MYRIHGTNAPDTIGQRVSSGCIRLTNEDVDDLFNRVTIGAKVVVLPMSGHRPADVAHVAAARFDTGLRQRVSATTISTHRGRSPLCRIADRPALAYGSSASRLY